MINQAKSAGFTFSKPWDDDTYEKILQAWLAQVRLCQRLGMTQIQNYYIGDRAGSRMLIDLNRHYTLADIYDPDGLLLTTDPRPER